MEMDDTRDTNFLTKMLMDETFYRGERPAGMNGESQPNMWENMKVKYVLSK